MRILYGVVGEGMGHAMRSRVVIEHLLAQGHDLEIMASSRAVAFLEQRFGRVKRIRGLHMVYEDNLVSRSKTLLSNLLHTGLRGVPANVAAYFELIASFRPELVVSDFESWTYLYARAHGLPVLSIDNMQMLNRCKHDKAITEGHRTSYRVSRAFVKGKLPGCNHYLVTTFFRPPVRKKRTTLIPPILRPEILEAKIETGDHLLVYQTGTSHDALLRTLEKTGVPCRVYGVKRDLSEDKRVKNLTYRPFSEAQFIRDLASARGVIAGGGFTLMGEAVYLKKPMLAIPLGRQFEQLMNARYLEKLGYGRCLESIESPEVVHDFIDRLPSFASKLEGYEQKGNRKLYEHLDALLDRAAAGVL
ncbi:MAG: teichoic acid biosynthesis protein [Deltaproteobacteria bacterium]|nr:teichoic acid biosynthesis protein [Deltaproteobacteria bacterium]